MSSNTATIAIPMSRRFALWCILVVYYAMLVRVIAFKDVEIHYGRMIFKLGPDYVVGHSNFVPLASIWPYLRGRGGRFFAILNIGGNILPFLPIGTLAALLIRRMNWPAAIGLGIAVGLSMELIEVIFHVGRFDVDDITLNALGVVLGYAFLRRSRSVRVESLQFADESIRRK